MPRFVLLYHECPPGYAKPSHWDFMLEFGDVLWTWELRQLPAAWNCDDESTNEVLPATRLADHRIEYLDYEGPVSGGRGTVTRIASGEFEVLEETPESMIVRLTGETICGVIELTETSQLTRWQLRVRQ